jgi:hypothetical protein
LGLQGVQWVVGNSRDAHKLARTPHANKKKIESSQCKTKVFFREQFIIDIFVSNNGSEHPKFPNPTSSMLTNNMGTHNS